jgi:hypothetical protein
VVFNIGSQQGGVVNNVTGDQQVYGGQHPTVALHQMDGPALLAQLAQDLRRCALPDNVRGQAQTEIDAADAEIAKPQPDKRAVAERLTRLAQVLSSAGALAAAGTALGGTLGALAGWLGSLGEPIRQVLNLG